MRIWLFGAEPARVTVTASPALAASGCPSPDSESGLITGSASKVDFAFLCDSGGLALYGSLSDTACDSMSAKVRIRVYYWVSYVGWFTDYTFGSTNSGGCGTWRSFSFAGDGSDDGKISVCTWAASTWSSTSETCRNFYFY